MKNEMKICIIVDAYSGGNLLAPEFLKRGIRCLHVQSTETIWPILTPTFHPEHFEANFPFNGDFEALVRGLKAWNPSFAIAGTETGVPLADRLSVALGLATNGTQKSHARRNKYEMIETLRRAGLPVPRQMKSRSAREIFDWMRIGGSSQNRHQAARKRGNRQLRDRFDPSRD